MPKFTTPVHERAHLRKPTQRELMWRAIRQLRVFDATKIAVCSEVTPELARRFIALLRRAGYVVRNGGRTSRLVRNSGPKPPVFIQSRPDRVIVGLLDRNDGKVYGLDGVAAPPTSPALLQHAGLTKQRLKSPRRRAGAQ